MTKFWLNGFWVGPQSINYINDETIYVEKCSPSYPLFGFWIESLQLCSFENTSMIFNLCYGMMIPMSPLSSPLQDLKEFLIWDFISLVGKYSILVDKVCIFARYCRILNQLSKVSQPMHAIWFIVTSRHTMHNLDNTPCPFFNCKSFETVLHLDWCLCWGQVWLIYSLITSIQWW